MRRVPSDAGEIDALRLRTRQECRKSGREAVGPKRFYPANRSGTAVAKEFSMLTVFAFIVALSSVFTSVFWACKEDTADRV